MGKSVMEQSVECFNKCDLEGLVSLWHEGIKAYDFKTNTLYYDSFEALKENDRPFVQDENITLELVRVLQIGNAEIGYVTIPGSNEERVHIFELEDGLIKNIWITRIELKK